MEDNFTLWEENGLIHIRHNNGAEITVFCDRYDMVVHLDKGDFLDFNGEKMPHVNIEVKP